MIVNPQNSEDTVKRMLALYHYQTHAWSYYAKAEELLQNEKILPPGQVKPTLVTIKLNMLELAQTRWQSRSLEENPRRSPGFS